MLAAILDIIDVNHLKIQVSDQRQLTAFHLESQMVMMSENEMRAIADLLAFTADQTSSLMRLLEEGKEVLCIQQLLSYINAFCPLDRSQPVVSLVEAGDLPESTNTIKLYFIE